MGCSLIQPRCRIRSRARAGRTNRINTERTIRFIGLSPFGALIVQAGSFLDSLHLTTLIPPVRGPPSLGPPIFAGRTPSLKIPHIHRLSCLPPRHPWIFSGGHPCPVHCGPVLSRCPELGPFAPGRHFFLPGSDPFVASETSGTATRPGDDLYRGRNSHLVEQRAFNHGAREPLQSGSICQAGHHRALA